MIVFLNHSEIDKTKWDACILHSGNGMVYAMSWYLDIVSPAWSALIEDDYSMVFPLTHRKKFGFQYLYQPAFTQQLGLFSRNKIEASTLSIFVNAIPQQFRLIEIQLNSGNTMDFQIKGIEQKRKITHHLPLEQNIQTIRASYSENLKRNIKKAQKENLIISTTIELNQVIDMFRSTRGKSIENMKDAEYSILALIQSAAAKRDGIVLTGAQLPDGKFVAGAVFLRSMHSYIFLFSATLQEGRDNGAMSAIIDRFIENHAGEQMFLDFEGSMDSNLARFYKSFGSKEVVYLQIRKNKLPAPIRWIKKK